MRQAQIEAYKQYDMPLYSALRARLGDYKITYSELALRLGKSSNSTGYISQRMNGKLPWSLDDAYAILTLLDLKADDLLTYFPPDGIPLPTREKKASADDTKAVFAALGKAFMDIAGA